MDVLCFETDNMDQQRKEAEEILYEVMMELDGLSEILSDLEKSNKYMAKEEAPMFHLFTKIIRGCRKDIGISMDKLFY